jgi:hypothetical protein
MDATPRARNPAAATSLRVARVISWVGIPELPRRPQLSAWDSIMPGIKK